MRTRVVSLFSMAIVSLFTLVAASDASATATPVSMACAATPTAAVPYPQSITDDAGRMVSIARTPERIVSIAPSNTEILYALGLEDRVVAVDSYSNYPPAATAKPQVGDYVDPDLERVAAASPDLIFATDVHVLTVVPALEALGLPVVVLEPANIDEVFADILLVGAVTSESDRAERLVCDLQARVDAVTVAIAGSPRPRVFFELSPDLFTAGPGSFVADVIERAGGENIAAGAAEMWPQLSAEAVVSANPEVILLADHEAGVTADQVAARAGWRSLDAVGDSRIVPIVSDLVARPGPRVVDGLEAIAAALHPDRFPGSGS